MCILILAPTLLFLALSGCAELGLVPPQAPDTVAASPPVVVPTAIAAPPPRPTARTADEFDTTTPQDRAAAVAAATATPAETQLGTTIASLGSPADPGIWLSTPLVTETVMGRVEYPSNGQSVALELRPSGRAPGSGSQISLPAMRLLDIPLTALPELTVYH